ncbi:choline transporter-like protein 4 [Octopus sinensis]|uniref:Choline transporter-like protein n=1 Tax=Octopus sinensis TaxID=2607531 RepID=A0A7E6EJ23_9MOLL|nr:choline transporter-like protein 4 [Octopus sinensis]
MQTFFIGAMGDIMATKYDLLVFTLISVVIALIFVMLLRCFAGIIICVALLAMTVALSFGRLFLVLPGTYFFITRYYQLKDSGAEAWPGGLTTNIKSYGDYYNLNLTIGMSWCYDEGCIFGILLGVLVLVILGCWKNIRVAIQLLKETSKLLYRPYLLAYDLFMWFWLVQFIDGINICVIAGSFSGYYWALNKPKDIPVSPVIKSLRYHLGSVAFGSLIIAIVKFIRAILEYISYKLKKFNNKLVQILLMLLFDLICRIMKCCFWCLEKFLKFLTQNAYIQVVGLISFITSRGIFEIFSTGVATLFLCYCFFIFLFLVHDLDKNDGTADKPYYMSKNLMKILGKKNKPTL